MENGHNFLELPRYTLSQVLYLYELHVKNEKRKRAMFIGDVRTAVWGEGKDVKSIAKDLLGG